MTTIRSACSIVESRCATTKVVRFLTSWSSADYFYFLHSFAAPATDRSSATVDYGATLCAAASQGNFHGVQFHPERSGAAGARVLRNFLEL